MARIKVLVVDDSVVVRKYLTECLEADPEITVVGVAQDGSQVLDKIQRLGPDVITMDIEMGQVDGITALKQVMQKAPMPVIMVSSYTKPNAYRTFRALELGAVDFVQKPDVSHPRDIVTIGEQLREKVHAAFYIKERKTLRTKDIRFFGAYPEDGTMPPGSEDSSIVLRPRPAAPAERTTPPPSSPASSSATPTLVAPKKAGTPSSRLIAIGISTGGPEALAHLLPQINANVPGIVIVQHMPPGYTRSLAERLNQLSEVHVKEAEEGDLICDGCAYIAPGGSHLLVKRHINQYYCHLAPDRPPVSRHKPSCDVLFGTVANTVKLPCLGIIMTGMGDDGVQGLMEMRDAGATTLAQDETTSVVFGMNRIALERGAAQRALTLENLPAAIHAYAAQGS